MASSSAGNSRSPTRPGSSRSLSSQAAGFSGRPDSRGSATGSTGSSTSRKATKKPGADSIMNRDPNAVSRGIKNLDQLMAQLQVGRVVGFSLVHGLLPPVRKGKGSADIHNLR
jgi:hypothetical protein